VPVALPEPVFVLDRCPPPFAFILLVPPPRLFPLVPPREFEPTLLLGVAFGITADRFSARQRVQHLMTR
jgi:hypothetical protein